MRSLIFTRSHEPLLDLPIRAFEGGTAGHVACRVDDLVVDSTFWQGGVQVHSFDEWSQGRLLVSEIPVEMPDAVSADRWLLEQVDKKYDWTALVGFTFWRDWSDDSKWYCSELAAAWLMAGGVAPLLATRRARVGVRLIQEIAHSRAAGRRQV